MDNELKDAVEISHDVYWVGERTDSVLERNIYLRVFRKGGQTVNMLIDPGPPEDLNALTRKAGKIVGDIRNIHVSFINHQDPDVGMNAAYLQKLNPKMAVISTDDTWRLIRFYGLNPKYFKSVNSFKDYLVMLPTGHTLAFIPTPFCHFKGACMVYDTESRILFSGDLLGGTGGSSDLYATEYNWEGVQIFHQLYMPVSEALQRAVDTIREINPPPIAIAPQHGGILKGKVMEDFLSRLYQLPVGLDLIKEEKVKHLYIEAINWMLKELKTGWEDLFGRVIQRFSADGSFPDIIKLKGDQVTDISTDPAGGFKVFSEYLMKSESFEVRNAMQVLIVKVLLENNLPMVEFYGGEEIKEVELFDA